MVQPNPGAQLVVPLTGLELVDILGLEWGTATTASVADTRTVTQGATATGTNQATAFVLTTIITNFTTAAASTGAVLPTATKVGRKWIVYNNGANPIQIYGNGTDTIDGVAGATGVTLTNARAASFTCVQTGKWLSNLLGATSS